MENAEEHFIGWLSDGMEKTAANIGMVHGTALKVFVFPEEGQPHYEPHAHISQYFAKDHKNCIVYFFMKDAYLDKAKMPDSATKKAIRAFFDTPGKKEQALQEFNGTADHAKKKY